MTRNITSAIQFVLIYKTENKEMREINTKATENITQITQTLNNCSLLQRIITE